MKEKILFVDRDGTLIHEPTDNFQVDKIEKFMFEPFVIIILKKFIELNFKLVLISNQDHLYTEKFPYQSFLIPHKCMIDTLESQGIFFQNILICPHNEYDFCNCRKPKTELVMYWIKRNVMDKKNSYVIGDRKTDVQLAENMGITGILYDKIHMNWNMIYNRISENYRHAHIIRNTKETKIEIQLWLNKVGNNNINTGIDFFNHMLEQICIHGNIVINLSVIGDIHIDDHHTVEDTGIVLGDAILQALGNKIGIKRFGFYVPMDESAAYCMLDISGRSYLKFIGKFKNQCVGNFSTNMVEHFFHSLSNSMKSTIHLFSIGKNDHHQIESIFKAFGRSLRQAISIEGCTLPTSKGLL